MKALPRLLTLIVFAALTGCVSCGLSPVPVPPNNQPVPVPPNIQLADVAAYGFCPECDGLPIGAPPALTGKAGAVTPPGATLWVVNLDSQEPPVQTVVAPDGSFHQLLLDWATNRLDPGAHTNEYRLEVRTPDQGAVELDIVVDLTTYELQLAPRPLGACFQVVAGLSFSGPSEREVELANNCSEGLEFSLVGLRRPSSSFTAAPAPVGLAPGESQTVTVAFAPSGAGPYEEILLIELAAPVLSRRAIVLRGAVEAP